jgi:hypothetical protein
MSSSYPINPASTPSPEFLRARSVAGNALQTMFQALSGNSPPSRDFRWIKAELTFPSFEHLTFGYRNKVFSVLVDVLASGRSSLSAQARTRCCDAARHHDLVPCAFPVDGRNLRPLASGWNLVHLADGRPVVPEQLAADQRAPMSDWELGNFAIQVVRQHVEQTGRARVLSYCDVPAIDPQMWIEDASGQRAWVLVRFLRLLRGNENQAFADFGARHPQLARFDGYLAAVSAASSEPVLFDLDGSVIPLSRRFDGTAPLYRGDGFYVKFDGLQRIHAGSTSPRP